MKSTPRKIGCLFGSFNPVHIGHLIIAEFMASQTDLDEVQLVVTPHNPLKEESGLAPERARLDMATLAVAGNPKLSVNNIEFDLPRPSYTIDTLLQLRKLRPDNSYHLIIGGDNLALFTRWKDWKKILDLFPCYVYRRRGQNTEDFPYHPAVTMFEPPYLDLSSTYIRECLSKGQSVRYMVPEAVMLYIEDYRLYQT